MKEKEKALKASKSWETRAYAAEEEMSSFRGKFKALELKCQQEKEGVIDQYLNSDDFADFVEQHDNDVRPTILHMGWTQAIDAVGAADFQGFDPSNFLSPWASAGDFEEVPPTADMEHEVAHVESEEQTHTLDAGPSRGRRKSKYSGNGKSRGKNGGGRQPSESSTSSSSTSRSTGGNRGRATASRVGGEESSGEE